ncbi:two-component system nitrogen regulation sensor histidine kinase GlnL [Pseudochelatococcus lubricantis]|uniref:histidine kinase n=1 Tax=Pseudochelatococcus lubricantis TaxID=1538102 RepID=A0ABX0UZ34_9HYPH|nr:ATP-binding protein [Pseudochelatococcus lubricantis]NIJ58217.1 two-component system nitrogen regulation sensor histidine kinase GlnL [Pseudochelatococcus lubricantis]
MSIHPSPHEEAGILAILPLPVLVVGADDRLAYANSAAETFFGVSLPVLRRQRLCDLVPFGSPALAMVEEVRERGAGITGYRVELALTRTQEERIVDIYAAPRGSGEDGETDAVVLLLQERTNAEKMGRQLTHRTAARSLTALGAILAHEIKNPLSGIRGAAQLLETAVPAEDRPLTRLICDETDRIVKLVERMETLGEGRPLARAPVNIHDVLDHVVRLAHSGFARHVRIVQNYDPSLPPVDGNRDQLIQVFLNLVKNAAEAIGEGAEDGEIVLTTAFRPGVQMQVAGQERVRLPLEISVRDNGPGVPADMLPNLFDPFVTTKTGGTGLGLALVAKIVGEHGGIIECDSAAHRTTFRVLLPVVTLRDGREATAAR